MLCAEAILQYTRRRRNDPVGSERRHDDKIQLRRLNTRIGKRHLGSALRKYRYWFIIGSNTAFMNPRAFDDPCVICLNHFFKVEVRQHSIWNTVPRSKNARTDLRHDSSPPPLPEYRGFDPALFHLRSLR